MVKKTVTNPVLETWDNLNAHIVKLKTEAECQTLLTEERGGRNRYKFITRIYSRMSKLRRRREMADINKESPKQPQW